MFIRQQCPIATPSNDGLMSENQAATIVGLPSETIYTNAFAGDNIGAQINAAMLTANAGQTVYAVHNGTKIEEQIVMTPGTTLQFGFGHFQNTLVGGPVILMRDDTAVLGMPGTTLDEPQSDGSGVVVCIGAYNHWLPTPNNAAEGNDNLAIRRVHFTQASTETSQTTGTVQLGNSTNVWIEDNYFDETSGFGVVMGGGSNEGFYSLQTYVTGNRFRNVGTQNIAFVNSISFVIANNILTGVSRSVSSTFIDLETNVVDDQMSWFTVTGNVINVVPDGLGEINPGAAIQVAGQTTMPADFTQPFFANANNGVIANNVINGGLYPNPSPTTTPPGTYPTYARLSQGIFLTHCTDVTIEGNQVNYISLEPVTTTACRGIHITGNTITNANSGGAGSINFRGSQNCRAKGNFIIEENRPYYISTPAIVEEFSTDYGVDSDYNICSDNDLSFFPFENSDAYLTQINASIQLRGAHSRAFNNTIDGNIMDAPELQSVAELVASPQPGTRNATNPPVVRLSGQTAPGDGGGGLWYFDPASSRTANGYTVATPVNPIPNGSSVGRWCRQSNGLKLTTSQIATLATALTAADASYLVFNTTTSKAQMWDGTTFQNLW